MNKKQMTGAFNEWMRRYTEEPDKFEAEFQSVGEFLKETDGGKEPSYGRHCAAYLEKLAAENAVMPTLVSGPLSR